MKLDTSTIENFENMSADDKLKALLEQDFVDTDTEKKYKDLISKANSEAKKYKDAMRSAEDKLKEHMSDEERIKTEEAERYKAIEEENERLKRDMNITKKTAFYQSIGFDGDLAKETAVAFVDGDFDTVEKNHKAAHEAFEKNIRADVVRNNPTPQNNGTGSKSITKAEIMAVKDRARRQQLIAENKELFTT